MASAPRDISLVHGKSALGARKQRLRAQGLRPIEIWVPDTRSPHFAAEARRQCCLIAESEHAAAEQAFIDAIAKIRFD